jgi:hypothetical protein
MDKVPSNVVNKELYLKVKNEIVAKNPKSSAYRSGRIVSEYKKRGGRYKGEKPDGGLSSWFKEEKWVNMREFLKGKKVMCSAANIDTSACRPLNKGKRKILTASEVIKRHGAKKVGELVRAKEKNMDIVIDWAKGKIKK